MLRSTINRTARKVTVEATSHPVEAIAWKNPGKKGAFPSFTMARQSHGMKMT
jgi:hypothetical protein